MPDLKKWAKISWARMRVAMIGSASTKTTAPKKTPAQGRRPVIEAGFIQARNLSSSETFIIDLPHVAKLKV
jgi:hypothetical protein